MMGSFFITARTADDLEMVQDLLRDFTSHNELVIGATQIEQLIVVRALGKWTEPMLEAFALIWQQFRHQWFGYVPEPPRIWAT